MATTTGIRTRPRWPIAALGTALGAVIGGAAILTNALAVHQPSAPFELDGDAVQQTADDDWNNVFDIAAFPGTPVTGDGEVFVADGPNLAGGKEAVQKSLADLGPMPGPPPPWPKTRCVS